MGDSPKYYSKIVMGPAHNLTSQCVIHHCVRFQQDSSNVYPGKISDTGALLKLHV